MEAIKKIQVREIMKFPVASTVPTSTIAYAKDIMDRKDIGALVIVDESSDGIDEAKVRGIVTSRDLRGVPEGKMVNEVMTEDIFAIKETMSVVEAAKLMSLNRVHHLLIVEGGEVHGILSSMDFVTLIAEQT